MVSGQASDYAVGERYLHGKTGRPVTLRYIGSLPPSTATSSARPERDAGEATWLGIEYDDPAHGRHSGTYKDERVFPCRSEGAGAFVKATKGVLLPGRSFIDALEERYGALLPGSTIRDTRPGEDKAQSESVKLGTSGIVVDAPGMQAVRARVGRLEKLREIGLENEWVSDLGADKQKRAVMADRLKGARLGPPAVVTLMAAVHTINLSGNLLPSWKEVAEIARHLTGLRTLVLRCALTLATCHL